MVRRLNAASTRGLRLTATRGHIPDRRHLLRFFARIIAQEARGQKGQTEARFLGSTLRARSPNALATLISEIFVEGTYEVGDLPSDSVIVDCGANIGVATFFFHLRYRPRSIVAFEPDPSAYELLVTNVTANGWTEVAAKQHALSDRTGTMDLFFDPADAASLRVSGLRERVSVASRAVECVRLSSVLPDHVDLLKIDVEGMEWAILGDLVEANALGQIDRIAIEYHHHLSNDDDRLSEFVGLLENAGFGYQIAGSKPHVFATPYYQDLMVYAYKKL